MEHNESTPSLVGANVRNVAEHDEYDKDQTSPTKAQSLRVHHDDSYKEYTSVNELADEGALINDEQEYGDLLDSTGNVMPNVSKTSVVISGVQDDKLSEESKNKIIEEAVPQPVQIDESHNDFVVVDIPHHPSVDVAGAATPVESSGTPSIYELKNANSGMSLEDLIDSQMASMTSMSTDLQKKLNKRKPAAPAASSSRSASRLRNVVETAIPDSVIENDSKQQVPAGLREGLASPLVQSRSQSAIRSADDKSAAGKPHLARGDSYSGVQTYESRPGRRADRGEGFISNLSSREYLRSVSRSRSRMGKETTLSNQDLTEEGALVTDDLDHDPEMIHQLDETLEEEEEDESNVIPEKPVQPVKEETSVDFSEEDSLDAITKKLEDVLREASPAKQIPLSPKKVVEEPEAASSESVVSEAGPAVVQEADAKDEEYKQKDTDVQNEEQVDGQDLKITTAAVGVATVGSTVGDSLEDDDAEVANTEPPSLDGIMEPPATEVVSPVDHASEQEDSEEEQEEEEEEEESTKTESASIVPADDKHAIEDHSESGDELIKGTEQQAGHESEHSITDVDAHVSASVTTDVSDEREERTPRETDEASSSKDASDQSTHAEPSTIDVESKPEDETTEDKPKSAVTEVKPVDANDGVQDLSEKNISEGVSVSTKDVEANADVDGVTESTKKLTMVSPVADETERLINELEAEIGDVGASVEDVANESVDGETDKDCVPSVAASDDTQQQGDVDSSKKEAVEKVAEEEVNSKELQSTEPVTPVVTVEETEEDEELHEPTREEIIEMLKDEPVYLYTSLAGGGFLMPQRTNRLATILTANRIEFTYRDLGTDEEARNVWRRYGKGRVPPGIVRGKDDIIGNWEEIEEANEEYRVRELIYETL